MWKKEYVLSIFAAVAGIFVLILGGYAAVLFFSPKPVGVPRKLPTTGTLPRPVSNDLVPTSTPAASSTISGQASTTVQSSL